MFLSALCTRCISITSSAIQQMCWAQFLAPWQGEGNSWSLLLGTHPPLLSYLPPQMICYPGQTQILSIPRKFSWRPLVEGGTPAWELIPSLGK